MGKRREPRKPTKLPVRIFGTDAGGRAFSANVFTIDVSRDGARVSGVQVDIKPGETIGLAYGKNKARFSVKWVGERGTQYEGHIGLLNLAPQNSLWDFPAPAPAADDFGKTEASERRKHPRLKCVNSVELHPERQTAPIWGKALDLSLGGCFVEMPIPLKQGTKLKIALWVKEEKLQLEGKVVNSRPGFGIGIQFTDIAPENEERLRQYLKSITRIPIGR
jgi:hypothetical protein